MLFCTLKKANMFYNNALSNAIATFVFSLHSPMALIGRCPISIIYREKTRTMYQQKENANTVYSWYSHINVHVVQETADAEAISVYISFFIRYFHFILKCHVLHL